MKNKFQMIDINIVSTYMGRYLTLGVTAVVLAITISALTGGGGLRERQPVVLEVPPTETGQHEAGFEPFAALLSFETGRAVRTRPRGEQRSDDCDLLVLSAGDFLTQRRSRELVALYSIESVERGRDTAVVIAKAGGAQPVPPRAGEIMFTHPRSPNGFWVQLAQLESEGFHTPRDLDSLRFAPPPGAGVRVVYSVATGLSALGACRASDVTDAVREGGVTPGELTIVASSPAVPEVVVACRRADADYYRRALTRIAAQLAAPETEGKAGNAVALLRNTGMRSLRSISESDLERVAALHEEMNRRIRASK